MATDDKRLRKPFNNFEGLIRAIEWIWHPSIDMDYVELK
jgi:hypothetical protein